MNSAQKPNLDDLPSPTRLIRSAVIAAGVALALLVTVVLPAERAIDPTGLGRVIGLTEMGEIKRELAEEAAQDALIHGGPSSNLMEDILGLFVSAAHAQGVWTDTITITLAPGASAETKLVMVDGHYADYEWATDGGRINFDLHAHGDAQAIDYDRGRGQTEDAGRIESHFDGEHGWFWRNRDTVEVTITLNLRGNYTEIVETY